MKQQIAVSGELDWMEIREEQDFEMEFHLEQDGYVELDLLAKSDSHWTLPDYESSVLRIEVQEEYNQDCILFYGNRPLTYTRLLGFMKAGAYKLRLAFNAIISSPEVWRAFVQEVKLHAVTAESDLFVIYKHVPVLYGRNLYHDYDNRYTDTPMLMFYWTEPAGSGRAIEYQILFSHEDEGTPTPLLMSKWGRTTDIEWVYRVVLDEAGEVRGATFQGPDHRTTDYEGISALGGHPVLQIATANGMVDQTVTSSYRFLFPPIYEWRPEREPRERVMDAFPFTYQVTAWEMLRQFPMERPVLANSFQLGDLRNYLYVQTAKVTENPQLKTSIDIQVKIAGVNGWFSGSFGDLRYGNFRCAYDGPYFQFSTTVKLPEGTGIADIEEVCAVWLPGGEKSVEVPEFKGFFLNEEYEPNVPIRSSVKVIVTEEQPRQTLWRRLPAEQRMGGDAQ
ncbi:hypothetical protein [Paenibacillus rigui]|uniref:Uncharacterized protein n=1 Tax=Paenibacillus rigui TaxID=554312 RepID=A0A229UW05_9BACL|nr:hypothetical protein [Paenibacillus rigui]OXM87622.1 hypothetical protein CF651_03880 [Paenibacillus rigui]